MHVGNNVIQPTVTDRLMELGGWRMVVESCRLWKPGFGNGNSMPCIYVYKDNKMPLRSIFYLALHSLLLLVF